MRQVCQPGNSNQHFNTLPQVTQNQGSGCLATVDGSTQNGPFADLTQPTVTVRVCVAEGGSVCGHACVHAQPPAFALRDERTSSLGLGGHLRQGAAPNHL
jgi:hypothetical protein